MDLNWPKQLDGAFGGAYRCYRIDGIEGMDVDTFFAKSRKFLIDLLSRETINRAVRSQATTWIRFIKDEVEQVELAFNSRMLAVYNLSDMNEIVSAMIEHMKQQIENSALRDSKFVFDRIIHMDINFHRLNLTGVSSYIPLPDWLAKKKAIINPKNSDLECFKWAVIAAMRWEEIDRDQLRLSKLRRYEDDFDWDGIKFRSSIRDIKRFESRNEITINILALEDKKAYICRKGKEYDRVANLMLITDHNKKHYIMIKSLKRLLSRQNSKHKESQLSCKKTNIYSLFNKQPRQKRSHGKRCYNKRAPQLDVTMSTLVDLVDMIEKPEGVHKINTKLFSISFPQLRCLQELALESTNFTYSSAEYRVIAIIMDIANFRLFRPVRSDVPAEKPKHFMKIKCLNKAVDAINLPALLRSTSVTNKIPIYFRDKEPPIVSYEYTSTVASKLFNFAPALSNLNVSEYFSYPQTCQCKESKFCYEPHVHVITGDLRIIENAS